MDPIQLPIVSAIQKGHRLAGGPLVFTRLRRLSEGDLRRFAAVTHCSAHADEAEDHHAPSRGLRNRRREADAAAVRTIAARIAIHHDGIHTGKQRNSRGGNRLDDTPCIPSDRGGYAVDQDRGKIKIGSVVEQRCNGRHRTAAHAILEKLEVEGVGKRANRADRVANVRRNRAAIAGIGRGRIRRNVEASLRRKSVGAIINTVAWLTRHVRVSRRSAHYRSGDTGNYKDRFPHTYSLWQLGDDSPLAREYEPLFG